MGQRHLRTEATWVGTDLEPLLPLTCSGNPQMCRVVRRCRVLARKLARTLQQNEGQC